jgi:hypothetical protein
MNGSSFSVTGLGRNIDNKALEKHFIKRVDRLCNNSYSHCKTELIYQCMIKKLIAQDSRSVIWVNWSDIDNLKQHFLLRASLATQGRS